MRRINFEYDGEEFDALVTIIKDNGGARALKLAIQSGLFMLIEENTLKEKGKSFSENYISTKHRDRILAGESLSSIANEIKGKQHAKNNKKDNFRDREKEENEYNSNTLDKEQPEEKSLELKKDIGLSDDESWGDFTRDENAIL